MCVFVFDLPRELKGWCATSFHFQFSYQLGSIYVCVGVCKRGILTVCGALGVLGGAVRQARAGGGGRQAGAGAGRVPAAGARARAALRHRHLGPHGAPARRAHRLVRYYEPENATSVRRKDLLVACKGGSTQH